MEQRGIQIMSIENLPAQMPLEASEYFSQSLFPHVLQMLKGNFANPVIKGATLTHLDGQLDEKHVHLYDRIKKHTSPSTISKGKRVLVLGSGYVAGPLIEYLLRDKDLTITIASQSIEEASTLANNRQQIQVHGLNVNDSKRLSELVRAHDIVVRFEFIKDKMMNSFIPANYHLAVAKVCISEKTDMVTASYISPELAAISDE